jgi:flagellar basal-body rod protein FlgG
MNYSIQKVAAKALAQEMRMEILANNLANTNTIGFKQDRTAFVIPDMQKENASGAENIKSYRVYGQFYARTDFSTGQLKFTGNKLDLALEGKGFFCVQTPDGIRYTRQGNFVLSQEGVMLTQDGFPVLGRGDRIAVEGKDIAIDRDGSVFVDGNEVDRLRLVDFSQPYALKKVNNTMFAANDPSVAGDTAEDVSVCQGFIELSNVDSVRMIVEMIETVRGYESYQKVMQYMDEAVVKTVNEVGRVA